MTSKVRPQIKKKSPQLQVAVEAENAAKFNRNQPTAKKENPYRQNYKNKSVAQLRNKDPNFHYCIVCDDEVDYYQDTFGFEFDPTYHPEAYDETIDQPKALTAKSGIPSRDGRKMYVMRIPREWNEENERLKASMVDAAEKGTKRGEAINNKNANSEGGVKVAYAEDERLL